MKLPRISSVKNLKGKRVLLRLDLNVPLSGRGGVADDFRIKKSIPTIEFLRKRGARIVILAHIGKDGKESLRAVARHMSKTLPVGFAPDDHREETLAVIDRMPQGGVLLLENIRRFPGELENSKKFAQELALLGNLFVNDGFSVSHRAHASVAGIPKFLPSYFGPLFEREVRELSRAFSPKHPFVFVLGGAKFSTKIPLVKKFLPLADTLYISGALANSFFKEKGYEVGRSIVDLGGIPIRPFLKEKKIVLPDDVVAVGPKGKRVCLPDEVKRDEYIYDIGPMSVARMKESITGAKMILWNGPLGYFEGGFAEATNKIAKSIAMSKAVSIVGGGDTVAALEALKVMNSYNFVSTGGGAMLDFLAAGTLPGIDAVLEPKRKKECKVSPL